MSFIRRHTCSIKRPAPLEAGRAPRPSARTGGFIALISVIIIGFVLLLSVVALGNRGIAGRFLLLDLENKEASEALANACLQIAMVAVVNNPAYSGSSVSEPVGSKTCTIFSVTPSGSQSTIKTKGVISGATTNLQVVINNISGAITSWQEIATLP